MGVLAFFQGFPSNPEYRCRWLLGRNARSGQHDFPPKDGSRVCESIWYKLQMKRAYLLVRGGVGIVHRLHRFWCRGIGIGVAIGIAVTQFMSTMCGTRCESIPIPNLLMRPNETDGNGERGSCRASFDARGLGRSLTKSFPPCERDYFFPKAFMISRRKTLRMASYPLWLGSSRLK